MSEEKKEAKLPTQKELNTAEIKENGFLNPFSKGVSYVDFLEAVGKDKKIEDYLKGKLSKEDIAWVIEETNKVNKK